VEGLSPLKNRSGGLQPPCAMPMISNSLLLHKIEEKLWSNSKNIEKEQLCDKKINFKK